MKSLVLSALLSSTLALAASTAALADRPGNIDLKTGFGEEFMVRHGLFGQKTVGLQDRAGDRYVKKQGLFGTKETDVNFLGNRYVKKKGLFGNRDSQVSSMFGDSITTHRGWFGLGRKQTRVDLSGMSSIVQSFVGRKAPAMGDGALPNGAGAGAAGMPPVDNGGMPANGAGTPDNLQSTY